MNWHALEDNGVDLGGADGLVVAEEELDAVEAAFAACTPLLDGTSSAPSALDGASSAPDSTIAGRLVHVVASSTVPSY